ncbi:MAG: glycosyltransferase family 9 protein [Verrucomicrobiae bacterium]|nr:glycosyltransferase family 9 protein [Verrucomicrobiae bacterium]
MRILLVSTTAIGDSVMATPFIRAARQRHPDAEISLFAHIRRMAVFEGNPHLNHLIPYHGKWKKLWTTLARLRRGHFDLVLVLHANDPDIVPLVRWTGAPQRVGWGESKWAHLFTHSLLRTDPPEHFLAHKKRLAELAGIPVHDLRTELFLNDADDLRTREEILPWTEKASKGKGYVVMHCFGTNPLKWWPLEQFFTMSGYLFKKHGLATVFVGDEQARQQVRSHRSFDPSLHLAPSGLSIRQSACVIRAARRMLTTDSGPMHLAFAVRCPTLCLFGPTHPSVHGPAFDLDLHRVIHQNPLSTLEFQEVAKVWDEWTSQIDRLPIST